MSTPALVRIHNSKTPCSEISRLWDFFVFQCCKSVVVKQVDYPDLSHQVLDLAPNFWSLSPPNLCKGSGVNLSVDDIRCESLGYSLNSLSELNKNCYWQMQALGLYKQTHTHIHSAKVNFSAQLHGVKTHIPKYFCFLLINVALHIWLSFLR